MPPNPQSKLPYYIAFNHANVFGPVSFGQLLKKYGSAQQAWEQVDQSFLQKLRIGPAAAGDFSKYRCRVDVGALLERVRRKTDFTLIPHHKDYPQNLAHIPDPPFILYGRGQLLPEDSIALAVVGSRKMSRYGQQVTESLVQELALAGLTIVSGLAFGVDAAAHKAALAVGGRTIAVLASGVDYITPAAHTQLGKQIITSGQGALVSEQPLGAKPFKSSFPVRNRLIAGLSLGVLVVEATERSGSMHTAQAALEQGKDVFAVPGSILSPTSQGTHSLIQQGAKLVQQASDVLEELQLSQRVGYVQSQQLLPLVPEEEQIVTFLREQGERSLDQVVRGTDFSTAQVSSLLTMMEMKGLVASSGGLWRVKR